MIPSDKKRTKTLAAVLAAVDDWQNYFDAKTARGERDIRDDRDGGVDCFLYRQLLEKLDFNHWPKENLRAFVTALVMYAPAGDLAEMARQAKSEVNLLAECRAETDAELEAVIS